MGWRHSTAGAFRSKDNNGQVGLLFATSTDGFPTITASFNCLKGLGKMYYWTRR
ncbi:hypothetical protein M404DRAFT_383372 [Pisolithus tinctorius Marx 270]|uniref:Uncharacterized protein n=1 Tax=Pisolithus tinctorius Marx 270 TaxID=870435 RepID=A0A0C3J9S2_PISTI|nr:hypothetical protein M404DRAFT_383372 [Pisolithus tinctorius Marx 270]